MFLENRSGTSENMKKNNQGLTSSINEKLSFGLVNKIKKLFSHTLDK